jgi:hypothetical protein
MSKNEGGSKGKKRKDPARPGRNQKTFENAEAVPRLRDKGQKVLAEPFSTAETFTALAT